MKRILVFLMSAALVAGALYAVPAAAQEAEAPVIPDAPNIVDDEGDAGEGTSSLGDVLAAWFTESGDKISVHFHMRRVPAPPASAYGIEYRLYASPEGEEDCFLARGQIASGPYVGEDTVKIFDVCGTGSSWFGDEAGEGEIFYGSYPDDTGWVTLTFDKALTVYSSNGSTLVTPRAQIHGLVGAQAGAFLTPLLDDTERGTDYPVGEEDGDESDEAEEPKKDKKKKDKKKKDGKKKGCKKAKKGKGKKRGCEPRGKKAPKPGPPACQEFVPGEMGKDQPTIKLTDEATEEKPVEQAVSLDMSAANFVIVEEPTTAYFNIQVDSAAKDAGLYALFEFPDRRDYDLILFYPDGKSFGAESTAGNTLMELNDEEDIGHGGEAGAGYEKLVGIRTNDCQGWTMEASNWFGEGGDFTVKLWLGEAKTDPLPEGEGKP